MPIVLVRKETGFCRRKNDSNQDDEEDVPFKAWLKENNLSKWAYLPAPEDFKDVEVALCFVRPEKKRILLVGEDFVGVRDEFKTLEYENKLRAISHPESTAARNQNRREYHSQKSDTGHPTVLQNLRLMHKTKRPHAPTYNVNCLHSKLVESEEFLAYLEKRSIQPCPELAAEVKSSTHKSARLEQIKSLNSTIDPRARSLMSST